MFPRLRRMALFDRKTWRPTWRARDEFLTARAPGEVHNTPAEPGPGVRTTADTENKISIGEGLLSISGGKAIPVQGDPAFYYPQLARIPGRAVFASLKRNANHVFYFGFTFATGGTTNGHAFRVSGSQMSAFDAAVFTGNLFSFPSSGILVPSTVVLRPAGAHYLTCLDAAWILQWVSASGAQDPLFSGCNSYSQAVDFDYFRVCDLPAPFATDFGLATQRLAGMRQTGDTLAHQADCLIEFTVTEVPTTASLELGFRVQDDDNMWFVRVSPTGDFQLMERVGGEDTSRGLASGGAAAGQRCVVICEGESIRGFSNNALRWTYTSAANFKDKTTGLVRGLGTGGAISDLISWPRLLGGRARKLLEAAAQ
jgi:hypothetical protein